MRTLGHLGAMAAEPLGVPVQCGAAPEIAAVEAARHQLAVHPGAGMAVIPVLVVLAVPRARLSAAPVVGGDPGHVSPRRWAGGTMSPGRSGPHCAAEHRV